MQLYKRNDNSHLIAKCYDINLEVENSSGVYGQVRFYGALTSYEVIAKFAWVKRKAKLNRE